MKKAVFFLWLCVGFVWLTGCGKGEEVPPTPAPEVAIVKRGYETVDITLFQKKKFQHKIYFEGLLDPSGKPFSMKTPFSIGELQKAGVGLSGFSQKAVSKTKVASTKVEKDGQIFTGEISSVNPYAVEKSMGELFQKGYFKLENRDNPKVSALLGAPKGVDPRGADELALLKATLGDPSKIIVSMSDIYFLAYEYDRFTLLFEFADKFAPTGELASSELLSYGYYSHNQWEVQYRQFETEKVLGEKKYEILQ